MMLVLGDGIYVGPMDTLCLLLTGFELKYSNIYINKENVFQRQFFFVLFLCSPFPLSLSLLFLHLHFLLFLFLHCCLINFFF